MSDQIHIAAADQLDYEWSANVMASNEPWITLRRDLQKCRDFLVRPGAELFVARMSGAAEQRAGFILLAPFGLAGSPYIASIGVAAEARGHGVGSRMLRFAEEHFAGRGHIFLLVSSFNHRAQKLYRQQNYEQVGELNDYIVPGLSELILHKRLA